MAAGVKRTSLKRVSNKKRRQDAMLDVSRGIVRERADGRCEVGFDGCTGRGSHVHHVLPRSIRVDHSPDNLVWACPQCHAFIHDNTREARALGLLTSAPSPSAGAGTESLGVDA